MTFRLIKARLPRFTIVFWPITRANRRIHSGARSKADELGKLVQSGTALDKAASLLGSTLRHHEAFSSTSSIPDASAPASKSQTFSHYVVGQVNSRSETGSEQRCLWRRCNSRQLPARMISSSNRRISGKRCFKRSRTPHSRLSGQPSKTALGPKASSTSTLTS